MEGRNSSAEVTSTKCNSATRFEPLEIFNSLLPGDKVPSVPPKLDCQQDGVGKTPLSKVGYEGKNLFVEEQTLFLSQRDWNKSRARVYVGRLVDMLLGARGTAFMRQRRKERKIAADCDPTTRRPEMASCCSPRQLLTKEFFCLIERKKHAQKHFIRFHALDDYFSRAIQQSNIAD